MLFYEDLLKKIEDTNIQDLNLKKNEKFGLNTSKKIGGYGISLPLIIIGLFQVYSYTIYHKWYLLVLGMIFLGIGFKQFKNIFSYSILINTENEKIKSGKLDMFFSDMETVVLKEMKLGKKVIPVIDIISTDKKQVIIPLYMNKQVRFILVLKKMLKDKFAIQK